MYNDIVDKELAKKSAIWLNQRFLEWQMETRKKQTIRSFAEYLSVKETTLSGWMRGVSQPTGENLQRLADKLGYEIFDILEVVRPDPIEELLENLASIPPDRKKEGIQIIRKWLLEQGIVDGS